MKTTKRILASVIAIIMVFSIAPISGLSRAELLKSLVPTASAADTTELKVSAKYGYAEARSMLSMVNQLRTGSNAWYWNESDTKKVKVSLKPLNYDYDLEKIAMQRALENAVAFGHTRPNGTICFEILNEYGYYYMAAGENIAAGYSNASSVFKGWSEEDEPYYGQGHRRNMLNEDFSSIGIGHVVLNGIHYWVQLFGSDVNSMTPTQYEDTDKTGTVEVRNDFIKKVYIDMDSIASKAPCCGEILPDAKVSVEIDGNQGAVSSFYPAPVITDVNYSINNPETATTEGNKLIIQNTGDAVLTASALGFSETKAIKFSHKYKTETSKATLTKDGSVKTFCTYCNKADETVIYHPVEIKLSASKFNYTGKAITPKVSVKDGNNKEIDSKNYTVKYSNNKNVGTAKVTITFKGSYTGTKTLSFSILPNTVTSLKATKLTSTTITLSWKKLAGAKSYKVEQSTNGKNWKTVKTVTANSLTIKNLKAGTKYQFRVTAYNSEKKLIGKTNSVLKTATCTVAPTVKLKSAKAKTVSASWKKVSGATSYVVYKSNDGKKWTKVKTTENTAVTLTKLKPNKQIFVKVYAVNAYKALSASSKVQRITVKK